MGGRLVLVLLECCAAVLLLLNAEPFPAQTYRVDSNIFLIEDRIHEYANSRWVPNQDGLCYVHDGPILLVSVWSEKAIKKTGAIHTWKYLWLMAEAGDGEAV